MSRIVMTGATGFIGRHTLKLLVESGYEVTCVVRPESSTRYIEDLATEIVTHTQQTSLLDPLGEEAALAVIHLATEYGRNNTPPAQVAQTNIVFSLELLDWSIRTQSPLFLNIDTCFTPDYPYLRAYTLSKKQFVEWGKVLGAEGESPRFINCVLQHPFGPLDGRGKFVPWLIDQCRTADHIDLTSGEQRKDFIYVGDVADALTHLIAHQTQLPSGFCELQVGRGESISVRAFVELVHQLTNSTAELRFGALPQRPGEITNSCAEIGPLQSIGWSPKTSVRDGIAWTIDDASQSPTPTAHRD